MDGQSHRAQLSAAIREHGGQSYANSAAADDNFLRNAGRNPGRDSRHGGRGGGVIGSRGRNSSLHSSSGRTNSQGNVAKWAHHLPQKPGVRNRPLDPAVEPDREYILKSKSRGSKPPAQRYQPKPSNLKARRPVIPDQSYENLLADPQGFLAAARSQRQSSTASVSHKSNSVAGSETNAQESTYSRSETESTAVEVVEEDVSTTASTSHEKSVTLPKPPVSSERTESKAMGPLFVSAGAQSEVNKKKPVKPYVGEHHSRHDSQSSTQTETKAQNLLKGFTSNLPQPAFISPKSPPPKKAALFPTPEEPCGDLLLDFSSTPSIPLETSKASPFQSQHPTTSLPKSPGVDDLMDIDFKQSSEEPALSTKALSPQPPAPASTAPPATMASDPSPNVPQTSTINQEAIAEYLKEISMLNDLVANSPLAGALQDMIKQRKQELEAKIFSALRTQSTSSPSEVPIKAATKVETEKPLHRGTGQAAHQEPLPATKPDSNEQKRSSMNQNTPKAESPLQKAVTAAPFVPSSSAWDYRSPRKLSASSESESPGSSGDTAARPASATVMTHDSNVDYLCQTLDEWLTNDLGPSVTNSSTAFTSSQQSRPVHQTQGPAGGSIFSNVKPPTFEGFSSSSTAADKSYAKAENKPFSGHQEMARNGQDPFKDSGITSNKPANQPPIFPNIPVSAATKQYACNASAALPQPQINTRSSNPTAYTSPGRYAVNISETSSKGLHTTRTTPNIPMSAAAKQYAINANQHLPERGPQEASKSPNIPLSAATKQYAVNAPKSAFKVSLYPETVTPPSAVREQRDERARTPMTLSSPGTGQQNPSHQRNDPRKASGLMASKYATPYY
ncbi:hypothetical protein Plec18170_007729 [Paecilomyces lecythidis]